MRCIIGWRGKSVGLPETRSRRSRWPGTKTVNLPPRPGAPRARRAIPTVRRDVHVRVRALAEPLEAHGEQRHGARNVAGKHPQRLGLAHVGVYKLPELEV